MATVLSSILERSVKKGMYIGVSWGETDKGVVDQVSIRKKLDVKVVPLLGGMGEIETGIHTNSIARSLAGKFSGTSFVINAPAVLESGVSRELMERDRSTRKILSLWDRIDIAIVGGGDLSRKASVYKYGSLTGEELEYLKTCGAVGEIHLNFIDADGRGVENKIDERLIRMSIEGLHRIPLVIFLIVGSRKIQSIDAALKTGVVDFFITDESTAEGLLRFTHRE
jgi:DNA-binding transcriptional regulator LsrR (DeoR family)